MKKIFSFILLGLMCSIGMVKANQTTLIDGVTVTLPDVPNASLDLSSQTTYTADANGWIVFNAYSDISNNPKPDWWEFLGSRGSQSPNSSFTAAGSSTTAPFKDASTGFKINKYSPDAAIRFTGAEKASFLVSARSTSANKEMYIALFTYDAATSSQAQVGPTLVTSSKDPQELLFSNLSTSNTYVAYIYGGSSGQNGSLMEIALKKTVAIYTVTYEANGGTGSMDATTNQVAANAFDAPTGKAFTGWNTAADGTGDAYKAGDAVTSNLTLYAQWATVYTVTYKANGGTGDDVVDNQAIAIAANTFTAPEGKMFAGWNTAADGTGVDYAVEATVTSNLTLYAQWATIYGEIIKAVHTDATTATVTGVIGGIVDKKTAADSKFGGKGQYFGLTLASGTFHTGDTLNVHLTTAGAQGSIVVYAEKEGSTSLYDTESLGVVGDNKFILPAAINGRSTIYICRTEDNTWNGYVDFISVVRPVPVESEVFEDLKINNGPTSYNSTGTVIDVIDAYLNPNVVVIKHVVYVDGTEKNVNVKVEDLAVVGNQYVGHVIIGGAEYTITIAKLTSYTVTYMDGEVELGTEVVAANGHPAEFADYQNQQLASFNGWFSDAELTSPVDPAAAVINANTEFYASFTLLFASSVNIEAYALRNGKSEANTNALVAQMGAQHYASNFAYDAGNNEIDYLNDSKDNRNYAYLGLKIKSAGTMFNFRVASGNTVKVKFGNVTTTPKVSINGGDYENMVIADHVYSYTAVADALVSIKTADAKAVVLQQIAIGEELEASELEVEVTLGENGYSTFATDYKYTVEGAEVYEAAYNGSNAVVLTEVVDAVVPANAGIILKGTAGEIVTLTASGSAATELADNGLVGVVAPFAATEGTYVLSTNAGVTAFNPCQVGLEIPAHKAYISIPSNAPAVRIIFAENGATGINELEGAEKAVKFIENGKLYIQKDGVVYDATGAKVK